MKPTDSGYKKWLKNQGEGRLYDQGRSTKGWTKGQKVTDITELVVGMIVIKVSHQFKAENLVVISPVPNELPNRPIRYCRYVKPDGTPTWDGHQDIAIWDFEIAAGAPQNMQLTSMPPWTEFYIAKKKKPATRQTRKQALNEAVPAKVLGKI